MKIMNPVIRGFHPDPSLVRAEDDYYIATSTFEWFPGVRIFHSKDMANWELISHALTNEQDVNMMGIDSACGIWAPNLTYDKGVFYLMYTIVYTNRSRFKDTYNFLMTAEDVRGPWSKPVMVNCAGFDPSLFHDTDGKKYVVNMVLDYSMKVDRFAGIDVQEYDIEKGLLIGKPKRVYKGSHRGFTEAPNIMKKGGWYYLVCAEGGTEFGHCAIVLRAKDINGPYEECPHNPIISSVDKPDCPLQRAGHMQIMEDKNNNWYMAHLCSRPVDGYSILGRETAIQNIEWTEDDWYKISANDTATPELYFEVPGVTQKPRQKKIHDTFSDGEIPKDYLTLRQSYETNGIQVVDGHLKIKGGCSVASKYHQGLLARAQESLECNFTAAMKFEPEHYRHLAGLVVYYNYDNVYQLRMTREDKGRKIELSTIVNREIEDSEPVYIQDSGADETYFLRAEIRRDQVAFYYSLDGKEYVQVGDVQDMRKISDEHVVGNGFTGSMVGVNCVDLQGDGCSAEFMYLEYEEL